MDPNPFYDVAKADSHSPQDVAALFVRDASPIWNDLQLPINHLVVGARGSGKTIALRQLDYRTLTSGNDAPDFVGVYTHVSRISAIFHALFADPERNAEPLARQFQQVFADYLALEIILGICELADGDRTLKRPDFGTVLRLPGGFEVGDVADSCLRLQMQIESSIQSWEISQRCAWQPLGDLPTIVGRLAAALRRANTWLVRDKPCLYVLLDESSPVPMACQAVLNSLLQRGQPYCAKLAVRPFEWRTLKTPSERPMEQSTDFFVLHLDHPDELGREYVSRMEEIVGKVLASREMSVRNIRDALPADDDYPYSGFDAICAASSGNPQDLLLICSAIFAASGEVGESGSHPVSPLPPSLQHDVVVRWSGDFVNQNAYDGSRRLCESLARTVKGAPNARRTIGFEYQPDEPDLFADGSLPDDLAEYLRPAFAGGFVRSGKGDRMSLFRVPGHFRLSRGALPNIEIPLDTPAVPPTQLDRKFIETRARSFPPRSARATRAPVLYVSSSFIEQTDERWEAVEQALLVAGFAFPKIRPTKRPPNSFLDTRRKIVKAQVALLGGQMTSRAMFEMGLCAGASRPVDVVIGRLDDDAMPLSEVLGMPPPTVSRQIDDRSYSRFAAEVRAAADQLSGQQSDFANVALTGVSLRPKRRREKTIYLTVPDIVADQIPQDAIRERLAACGWSMIAESDMTSYAANELQVPVLCAFTARVGVVDTTAVDGLDAIQSYKLGLFAGQPDWRVLHTSNTETVIPSPVDRVAGAEYFRWEAEDELLERILRFVQA